MSSDPQQVQDLFWRMVKLPQNQRAAALELACGRNTALRRQVERLLEAHDEPDSFLDREDNFEPTVDSGAIAGEGEGREQEGQTAFDSGPTKALESTATAGMKLGERYVLQEVIGEGGMGEVWVAKQVEPVRRKVAIKLIKKGMDSRAVLNRFEQERQALALMDHPNIARVLDGGISSTGQPYFVMELVNGLSLTRYCDEAMLAPRERLELFVLVCHAVQHAHQKGIIHRDLKPANILVTVIDGKPIPKVIDFGVSKAVGGKLTDESLSTQFGAVVGTLEYMSPEQAGYSGMDVDTRTDIYSLGIILYELLTGLRPIDGVRLKRSALTEMLRIIQEEEPSRPSTRLSTNASLPSVAAQRQMEPKKLMALLRGELDWVVMKCLEKQRDRRYETAAALARDLLSFLSNAPVEARPPSTAYRLQKLLTRHKLAVTAAAVVAISLLLGVIGTTWGWLEARRQGEIAESRRQEATAGRAEAERQRQLAEDRLVQVEAAQQEAEQEQAIAVAVREFLQRRLLGQADVVRQADALLKAGGRVSEARHNPTIRELLDRAAAELSPDRINDSFPDQPLVQAEILQTVGSTYDAIGVYGQAIPFLRRALALREAQLGPQHEASLVSKSSLALAILHTGDFQQAIPLLEEAVELSTNALGPEDRQTLSAMGNLAGAYQEAGKLDEGLELFSDVQAKRKTLLGEEHRDVSKGLVELGVYYFNARQPERAQQIFQDALPKLREAFGADHPHTLTTMNNLAMSLGAGGRYAEALAILEEAHQLTVAKLGDDHPLKLQSQTNLAGVYSELGRAPKAIELLQDAIPRLTVHLGRGHPYTINALIALADTYRHQHEYEQALTIHLEAYGLSQETYGENHPETLMTKANLASLYSLLRRPAESLPLFEDVYQKRKELYGDEHPSTLLSGKDVGANYIALGRIEEGRPLLERALQAAAKDPQLLDVVLHLTMLDFAQGNGEAAVGRLENTLEQYRTLRGPNHRATLKCTSWLATAYYKLAQLDKSIPLFESLLPRQTQFLGAQDFDTLETTMNLAVNYDAGGRLEESLELYQQVLRQDVAAQNPNVPKHLQVMLGTFAQNVMAGNVEFALDLLQIILEHGVPEHVNDPPAFLHVVSTAATIHQRMGNQDQMIAVLERGIQWLRQTNASTSPETLRLMDRLGVAYWTSKQFSKAVDLYQLALESRAKTLGRQHEETLRTIANLGINYKDWGQYERAAPLLEEAYRGSLAVPTVRWVGFPLLDVYVSRRQKESATTLADDLLRHTRDEFEPTDRKRIEQTAVIVLALLNLELFAEAEAPARELLSIRKEVQPEHWSTFNAMAMLGGALLGQDKVEEAESMLLEGYQGMKARQDAIPELGKPRVAEALEKLIQLYTSTGQAEQQKRFQDELAEWRAANGS